LGGDDEGEERSFTSFRMTKVLIEFVPTRYKKEKVLIKGEKWQTI